MGKLAVSSSLIAKASAAGTAAVAATTAGIIYDEEISDFFYPDDFISLNERLKGLGLPDDCKFEEGKDEKDCGKLNFGKLKAINFADKSGEINETTIADEVTLKIKKAKNRNDFPGKIKIVFKNTGDVSIKKKEGDKNVPLIEWKNNTNPEYKIEGGKLEKAWSATKLAQKVGFTSCDESDETEECTFGTWINVFINKDSYMLGGRIVKPSDDDLMMSYESEAARYNQGFKFKIEDGLDGIEVKSWWKTITLETGSFYEIKEQEISGRKYWFLSKKDQ